MQDDLEVKSLATRNDIKKSNDNFFKKSKNFGDFLDSLKKKVNTTNSSVDSGGNLASPAPTCDIKTSQTHTEQSLAPIDLGGDPDPTPTPSTCPQCSSLEGTSIVAIRSPFTYSIDEQSLMLLPAIAPQDFRNRIASAAAD